MQLKFPNIDIFSAQAAFALSLEGLKDVLAKFAAKISIFKLTSTAAVPDL